MKFYYSLFHLVHTVEGLEKSVRQMAGRTPKTSPQDALANRLLLEQCDAKLNEVKALLDLRTHFNRLTMRKAGILFEVLELSHLRMVYLMTSMDGFDQNTRNALCPLLSLAQRHYRKFADRLVELTGNPLPHSFSITVEDGGGVLSATLVREAGFQGQTARLLEKSIQDYDEDAEWLERLRQIRNELLEAKKSMMRISVPRIPSIPVEEFPLPIGA